MSNGQRIETMANDIRGMAGEFVAFWMAERDKAENKSDWPLVMPPGEWWEQFLVWAQERQDRR